MPDTLLILGFAFICGSVVGSFLNVCIYRVPRDQSILFPASHCVGCQKPIAWYDNLPLLSYTALFGRCRHCRAPIHWRYPVIELLTASLTVAVIAQFGLRPVTFCYLALVYALIVISFIDLEFRIIPTVISVGGLLVAWALSPLVPAMHGTTDPFIAFGRSMHGAMVGCSVLYLTGSIGSMFFQKEAMGLGDVDLLAMAGAFLGWKAVVVAFFVSPLLAVIPGLVVLVRKKSHEIPYGPFLSLGLLIAMFAGDRLIALSGVEQAVLVFRDYYGSSPK